LVQSYIELGGLNFSGGAFGNGEKLKELSRTAPFKPSAIYGLDGNCGAPYLITQTEILGKKTGLLNSHHTAQC
jgi:hypothetical protein